MKTTAGLHNTAVGYAALLEANHADADGNTAVGYGSLQNVTEGATNVGVGKSAGAGITTGDNHTAIGKDAGKSISTNSWNSPFELESLKYILPPVILSSYPCDAATDNVSL